MAKQSRSAGRGKLGWIAPRSGGYTPKDTGVSKRGEPPTGRASSSSAVKTAPPPATAR